MSRLAPQQDGFEEDAFSRQQVMDKLRHWREHLVAHDRGLTNCILARGEIVRELDKWLDELIDLRGR